MAKKRASQAANEIVIRLAVDANSARSWCDTHGVEFLVMPPPKISGLDELWKIADAAAEWTHITALLREIPKANVDEGVADALHMDLVMCFTLLERALKTGKILEMADSREDLADDVIDVAQQILEMDARGEVRDNAGVAEDALALLSSAREALAGSDAAVEAAIKAEHARAAVSP